MDADFDDNEFSFEVTTVTNFGPDFQADHDSQNVGMPDQSELVNTSFDYDFNLDMDLETLVGAAQPSGLLPRLSAEVSAKKPDHDATRLAQDDDDFYLESVERLSNTFSTIPNDHLNTTSSEACANSVAACSNPSSGCMIVALKLLRTLHMPPTVCLSVSAGKSGDSSNPRRIESVLSTNREAIQMMSGMLECPCSLNFEVQMILVILCGKVTAWYRAIIHKRVDGSHTPSSIKWALSPGTSSDEEDPTERILHQPITVGDYNFDATLEGKIRAQVASSELQNVESLTKTLTKRVEETHGNLWNATTSTGKSVEPDQTRLANAIDQNLTVSLRKQLSAARAETRLILESEQGWTQV